MPAYTPRAVSGVESPVPPNRWSMAHTKSVSRAMSIISWAEVPRSGPVPKRPASSCTNRPKDRSSTRLSAAPSCLSSTALPPPRGRSVKANL